MTWEERVGKETRETQPERTYSSASTNKSECRQVPVQMHASAPPGETVRQTGVKMRHD